MKIKVHPNYFDKVFHEVLTSQYRYNILWGGSGSGKSYFLAHKLVLDLIQSPTKLLVIRQTYASMRDSVFAELVSAVNNLKLGAHVVAKTTPLELNFSNGSQVLFKGGDDEQKLLSISGVDKVWVEEAGEISQDLFHQLELRLRGGKKKKQFFLSFNPVSAQHWLKQEFFDVGKPDCLTVHSTYLNNRHLEASYIETLEGLKTRNYQKYLIYALGQWGVVGKQVFEDWELLPEDATLPRGATLYGLDFSYGGSDPTAFIELLVDEDNKSIYVVKEWYKPGALLDETYTVLASFGLTNKTIYVDSANKSMIHELKQKGLKRLVPAQKGPDSVAAGLNKIKEYKVYVHPSCENMWMEYQNYSYKKNNKTGLYEERPVDNFNHLMDAFRYALSNYNPKRINRSRTLDKTFLGL